MKLILTYILVFYISEIISGVPLKQDDRITIVKVLDSMDTIAFIVLQCHVSVATNRILQSIHKKILKINALPETIRMKHSDPEENADIATQLHCYRNKHVTMDERYLQMSDSNDDSPIYLIASLVVQLNWGRVEVFYDTSSGPASRLLTEHFSLRGILLDFHNIDDVTNLHNYLRHIYDTVVTSHQELNAVVAGLFDSVNTDRQTMLCFLSKWLVLVPDLTPITRNNILKRSGCLYNVATLALPRNKLTDPEQMLMKAVVLTQFRILEEGDSTKLKTADSFFMNLLSSDIGYTCDGFLIDTIYHTRTRQEFDSVGHTRARREFGTVGHTNLRSNVTLLTEVFPNKNYGYNQKVFKVTTLEYSPFVMKRNIRNNTVYEGPFIDLLNELSRALNFSYTLSGPPDGKWGSVERWENKTPIFNGLIGQIQRRECDFAAAPLSIHPTRELVVDFSYPVYHEYTSVLVRSMDAEGRKWRTLLNPLKAEVLFAIGAVIPVITTILFVVETLRAGLKRVQIGSLRDVHIEQRPGGLIGARDAIWCTIGSFLGQGGMQMPASFSGSTLLVTWWLFGTVTVGAYCGNLIAFLTVSKVTPPFNSLQDMATKQDDYQWGVAGGTNLEIIFKTSTSPELRHLGDAMLRFNQSDPRVFDVNVDNHLERVKLENYAYIGETTEVKLAMLRSCDLMKMKDDFLPVKNAFVFQETSPHRRIFSEQIMKIEEAGLFAMWRRKWWPKSRACVSESVSARSKPITLSDVQGAFYICIIGIVAGSLTLIIEIVYFRIRIK